MIGQTKLTRVPLPPDTSTPAVREEEEWQKSVQTRWYAIRHSPIFIAVVSVVAGLLALAAVVAVRTGKYRHWLLGVNTGRRWRDVLTRGRYKSLKDDGSGDANAESYEPLMERERENEHDG